jgi:predicted secreted protein
MKLRNGIGAVIYASVRIVGRFALPLVMGAALAISAGTAQAGDAAARRIIGFSPDGAYFAFEQYGTLDAGASGSGWSQIDIIDTRTDEFVGGKPILVVDETEEATLTLVQARAQAAAQAAPVLARYAVASQGEQTASDKFTFPGEMVAYNDVSRLEQVSQKSLSPLYDETGVSTIQLDEILAASTGDCSASFDATRQGDTSGKALGFRLTLQGQDGKPFKILHEDKGVPGSRNCPTSYSLSESYAFTPAGKPAVIVVLVQRFSQGFEGRDRRFLAVTGQPR